MMYPPGLRPATSTLDQSNNRNHTTGVHYALRVRRPRRFLTAGADDRPLCQAESGILHRNLVKLSRSSQSREVSRSLSRDQGNGVVPLNAAGPVTPVVSLTGLNWTKITASLTAPIWTGTSNSLRDDHRRCHQRRRLLPRRPRHPRNHVGRLIYRQVLGPGVNSLPSGATNPNGIYWIDCGGNKLLIERSRILGTLVVLNPGPARASPMARLTGARLARLSVAVGARQFRDPCRRRDLERSREREDVNFNPSGMPYDFNNSLVNPTDTAPGGINDGYPSEIQGLVAVSGNLDIRKSAPDTRPGDRWRHRRRHVQPRVPAPIA